MSNPNKEVIFLVGQEASEFQFSGIYGGGGMGITVSEKTISGGGGSELKAESV